MEDVEVSTQRGNLEGAEAPDMPEKNGEEEVASQENAATEEDPYKPKLPFGSGRPRNTSTQRKQAVDRKKANRLAQAQRATAKKYLKHTAGEHAERWATMRDKLMVFQDVPVPQMDPMFSGMLLDR